LPTWLSRKPRAPGPWLTPRDGQKSSASFWGFSELWCENTTDETARLFAQVDPHSPGRYRVNGALSNMPEFQRAFSCKADAPMVRESVCRVW